MHSALLQMALMAIFLVSAAQQLSPDSAGLVDMCVRILGSDSEVRKWRPQTRSEMYRDGVCGYIPSTNKRSALETPSFPERRFSRRKSESVPIQAIPWKELCA